VIIDEIAELLRRKQQLDAGGEEGVGYAGGEGRYTQRQRWMGEAIELLLKLALENEKREKRYDPGRGSGAHQVQSER
jgi:hypothetical protein